MSDAFIGIESRNEFFTQHYLAAILKGDLKDVLQHWREEASARNEALKAKGAEANARTPPRALGQCDRDFFAYAEALQQRLKRPGQRVEAHRELFSKLLRTLGYKTAPALVELPSGHLPRLAEVRRSDGSPQLWWVPAVSAFAEATVDPDADDTPAESDSTATTASDTPTLSRRLLSEQYRDIPTELAEDELRLPSATVEELVTEAFNLDEAPRFVVICGDTDLILAERAKWAEQRLLRFDLAEVLSPRSSDVLDVAAALLHRECLVPDDGAPLLDTLDDNSHKHAFEVSEDLKYALQASIELLGNAAIRQLRERQRQSKVKMVGSEDADDLARECLRYMYRLLFLFYIEARPELGYAPIGADAYRLGYSLERLRDLEQLDLQTEEARQGSYIHESLERIFALLHGGTPRVEQLGIAEDDEGELKASKIGTFELSPLRSRLFDPAHTPLLSQVVFPNEVLREVIEAMSLTRPGKRSKGGRGKLRRRGRISYATLGINQLGAVYEALLSFRGFFADEDLFEVKPAKESGHNVLQTAYFVPEREIGQYSEKEQVYEEDHKTLKRHPKGTFIYRLAGRDRQTSASFYTPEVLTRCLVKYALKELLEDRKGRPTKTADEILRLTICEPAMGSAAFLNEAVSQLAEAYLQAKQRELGERIANDRYGFEKQRVKMFIADNNVFGVDLNPIARELAEVSLWLNTIHEGGFVPWFGGQTVCGNSLIGARREVFKKAQVNVGKDPKKPAAAWRSAVPTRVPLGKKRPKGSVYHFLLGDLGMAVYGQGSEGKPIRAMAAESLALIDAWRKGFCAPVEDSDRDNMAKLSDAVDRLWSKHAELLRWIRQRTTDPIEVYGRPLGEDAKPPTTTAEKDAIWHREMLSERVRASSPYSRLKLVMDYWCALWFWPIEEAALLPERGEFLTDLALLLDTDVLTTLQGGAAQKDLFAPTMPAERGQELVRELGVVDVDRLVARNERLQLVQRLAEQHRFLHWELEFADLFVDRGGFDLMLGNPPWIKVQWTEKDLLGDSDPSFVLKGLSSAETAKRRDKALERAGARSRYYAGHEASAGAQSFLGSKQNYPELQGIQPNLYKCFLPLVWRWTSRGGVSGLLHPEGVYDDPKGGRLRGPLYSRLRRHYQFANALFLFQEVHDQTRFSVNIYGPPLQQVHFSHIANLFTPATVDACHEDRAGHAALPGLKEDGTWAVAGHRDRVIEVNNEALALFAALYDKKNTPPQQARLPAIHSRQLVEVLTRFREAPRCLADIEHVFPHDMWHESRARKAGIIDRAEPAVFPSTPGQLILSGPHFFVGNPHYKSPRAVCTNNSHYDVLDLRALPADYLPRTNYIPACTPKEYATRSPKVPWREEPTPVTDFYRVVTNRMIGPAGERTLQAAIAPPKAAHINTVYTYTLASREHLLATAASWSSIPIDFFVKSTGSGDFFPNLARQLPLVTAHLPQLFVRTLLLNCLTTHYADLWRDAFDPSFTADSWAKSDPRLVDAHFAVLKKEWSWRTPLRTDYARRQALVELDVLVAMDLGLTLDQLQTIYRAQFYVLRQNEDDTWYDREGRIIFTCSKGLTGVGLPRKSSKKDPTPGWEDVRGMKSGTVERTIVDDTLPGGPVERTIVYHAPFDRCDREQDYATAWRNFEARFAASAPTGPGRSSPPEAGP